MEKGVFLCAQVGGDFLGENQAYSVYMYEGGTFKFDGMTDFLEYGLLEYQFMRCVRGSFAHVRLECGGCSGLSGVGLYNRRWDCRHFGAWPRQRLGDRR